MKTFKVERIRELLAEIAEFNSVNLEEIILTENDEPIQIPKNLLEEFKFCGLANKAFVEMEWWKPENHVFEKIK